MIKDRKFSFPYYRHVVMGKFEEHNPTYSVNVGLTGNGTICNCILLECKQMEHRIIKCIYHIYV